MNFNILSFVKEQLSGYVIGKMSDFLGENPYKTASALENVLPVVLGGLVNKSSNIQGAGLMMDQIKDAGHDGKVFDKLNDIVKDPDAMLDWLSSGSSLSGHIFDDKLSAVIDGVSGENDIRKTSAASLLSFLSPLVLGAVGKHITNNSLGISGITDLMASNRSVSDQGLSPDMKYILGMDNKQRQSLETPIAADKPATNTNTANQNNTTVNKKPKASLNWAKWLPALLLVGLLSGLAYYFLNKKQYDANTSFFDKWTKKDTSVNVSTSEGDSLKLKLEKRRKDSELTDKATVLSKSSTEASATSGGSLSLVDSLKQKLEQRRLKENGGESTQITSTNTQTVSTQPVATSGGALSMLDSLKQKLKQRLTREANTQAATSSTDKTTISSSLLTTKDKVEPEPPKVEPPKVTKVEPPKVDPPKVTKVDPPKVTKSKTTTRTKANTSVGFSNNGRIVRSRNNYNRQTYNNNSGYDQIIDIDNSSSSYSSRSYQDLGPNTAKDLSSAIRNRSLNAEFVLNGISFVEGSYEITKASNTELNRLAGLLKSNARARVFIQGFAMNGNAADQDLSQMRAEWVRYALIDKGVNASKIVANSHGQASQTSLGNIPRNKVSMKLIGI